MPTYEYRCEKCGTVQEVVHAISEEPANVQLTLTCEKGCTWEPHESGMRFRRLVCGSSFALQGQGWARDGYR